MDRNDYCLSIGATYASMHSEFDYQLAKARCKSHGYFITDNTDETGCYFGLNDIENEGIYEYTDNSTTDYGFSVVIDSNWTMGISLGGNVNTYNGEFIDIGSNVFNDIFRNSNGDNPIIRRQCRDTGNYACLSSHQDIYYKRLQNKDQFDAYENMKETWSSNNNTLGIDFNLYSSLSDALSDTNAWSYCNYDDIGVGAFGDCGPSGVANNQWTADAFDNETLSNPREVLFSIYTPNYETDGKGNKYPTTNIYPWSGPNNYNNWEHCCNLRRAFNTGYKWNDHRCDIPQWPLCNQVQESIHQCLNPGHEIDAWYDGSSIEVEHNLWYDKSGNNHFGNIVSSTDIEVFNGSDENNIELYLNGQPIVTGTPNTQILFNVEVNRNQHTIIHVSKYRDVGVQKRVLTSRGSNDYLGHQNGRSGVAFYFSPPYITEYSDKFDTEWVLSSIHSSLYRGNFINYTVNTHSDNVSPKKLCINYHASMQNSDFATAELIVFNGYKLDNTEIECIEDYLQNKYGLPVWSENYIFVPTAMNFSMAESYCFAQYGTGLASIHNVNENIEINEICNKYGLFCWIGLNDRDTEGVFLWSDGAQYIYNNYPGDLDNNNADTDDCLYLNALSNGDWDITECSEQYSFFCNRYNPTQAPTVEPTLDPTKDPSMEPSETPTHLPSLPSLPPSDSPTETTSDPTTDPSVSPTEATDSPTSGPTNTDSGSVGNDEATKSPTLSPETIPVIIVNITILDGNITLKTIVDNVNNSIKTYLYVKFRDEAVDYRLFDEVSDNNNERVMTLDIYIMSDVDKKEIDEDSLQTSIQQNLQNPFGNKVQVEDVIVNYEEPTTTDNLSEFAEQQTLFQQLSMLIAGVALLLIGISWIDAKFIRQNDFYQIGPLFSALFHILDTWTDVFFALQCISHPDFVLGSFSSTLFIIFLLSLVFIIIPLAFTLYQLYSVSNKHWSKNDDLRGYLSGHLYSLYMVSIICGSSFAGIKLFRSRVFNLSVFDIPLTKQQSLHFETKKVYSTILLIN